jgi:hypothetical protein
MAGQYDYTVNIPQPPAQNFLQSLLGIQQLQGLQQQQDIQQQQAQFAQQMQPLQIQTEQARLGQIGQATATGAEALRQGKITFEQGQQDRVRGMEQQAIAQAQTQKIFGEIQALPANASIEEITKKTNMLALINPTAAKQIGENLNQLQKQYQENAKLTAAKAGALLDAGEYEKAAAVYAQAADAVEANAGDNEILKNLANGYKIQANLSTANPVGAKSAVASLLGVVDPAALNAITAARKETTTGKDKQVDEEKRALDLEKERLQIKEIQQKLDAGRADKVKIYASQNKEGYKLSEEIRNQTLQAEKAKDILQRIDSGEVKLPEGTGKSIVQAVRDRIPFFVNDVSFLRTQYQALLAPEAKKNLPPGSASDADMKAAREGLLNKNATPKQFRKAVEIIGKISEDQAKYTEARLGWISENEGSIGTAVKDISVFGTPIKKGTPLNAWWSKIGKDLDPYAMPSSASPAAAGGADLDAIINKYR